MRWNNFMVLAGVMAAGSALFAQNIPTSQPATSPANQSEFSQPASVNEAEQGLPEEQITLRLASRGSYGAIGALDADGIRQALTNAVQSVISGHPAGLVGDFATSSRRALSDSAALRQQLDPTLSRLKRDFRNRYNEPLEFQSRPEAVFNHSFFLVGNAVSTDVPMAMRNNRDRASAIIGADNGLPELTVPVARENGQWLLASHYRNQNELSRRLRAALARADQDPSAWPANATEARRAIAHAVLAAFSYPSSSSAK